jgi:hypothetical protein
MNWTRICGEGVKGRCLPWSKEEEGTYIFWMKQVPVVMVQLNATFNNISDLYWRVEFYTCMLLNGHPSDELDQNIQRKWLVKIEVIETDTTIKIQIIVPMQIIKICSTPNYWHLIFKALFFYFLNQFKPDRKWLYLTFSLRHVRWLFLSNSSERAPVGIFKCGSRKEKYLGSVTI